jgi:hypothetical protein
VVFLRIRKFLFWTVGLWIWIDWFVLILDCFRINQLLIQTYNHPAACTIALLPYFTFMVFTAELVFYRRASPQFNGLDNRVFTIQFCGGNPAKTDAFFTLPWKPHP